MTPTPADAASTLHAARSSRRTITPFTDAEAGLDARWGLRVQAVDRATRRAAGEALIGAKLGLTSRAKQDRMGVTRPIFGFLTDAMLLEPSAVTGLIGTWAQPRVEPEIAFVTSRDISGPLTHEHAGDSVASVLLAAEIIDSRYTDYRFLLADVLADNTSAAGVVCGPAHAPADVGPLADLRCTVTVDGSLVHEATGAAILGDPMQALTLLGEHLAAEGEVLPAGSLVLAGALTDAVPLTTGSRYELAITGLGSLTIEA